MQKIKDYLFKEEKRMKKVMTTVLSTLVVSALCACGGGTNAPKEAAQTTVATQTEAVAETESAEKEESDVAADYSEITMKFGTSSAESTLTAKAFMDWGERLDAASGGKVKVDVYCSGVLGNNTEMVQGAQMGTVDVVVIQPAGIADMGAQKMNLLSFPYLFGSYEQYYKTLFGEVGDELLRDVTDHVQGLIGFSYLPDGGRCYFTKGKAIRNINDIKGMKLRVQSYAIDSSTAKAIGFSATPTAFSELYSALQTGVVDGAENPLSGIDGNALYEVSDYLTLDNHTYNIPVLVVSQKTWESLNEETQKLMKETWMESVEEFYKPQLAEYENGLLEKFKESGVEIVEIEDYDKWVEAVQPVWSEYGAGLEDLVSKVQTLAN